MADHKRPSLTVLGGPMAGTRFVLDEAAPNIAIGSDPSSNFRLTLPGVSPTHARLVIDAAGVTIHDAGSARGLHVNDSRVTEAVALHNGDIVWLGTPGEVDVVMLQCILPRPPTPPPAPVPLPPPEPAVESETLALGPEALALAPETPAEATPTFLEAGPEPPDAPAAEEPPHAAPAAAEFFAEEVAEVAPEEPTRFEVDKGQSPPSPSSSPPTFFEDETETLVEAPPGMAAEGIEPTIFMDGPEVTPDVPEPTEHMAAPDVEPTLALTSPHVEIPEPIVHETPAPAPPPVAAKAPVEAKPPQRAPAPPVAPAAPRTPAAKAPAPAARRAATPAPPAAPKREAPTPARPRPAGGAATHPPAPRKSSSRGGLYALLGLGAVVVIGGGLYAAWRFLPLVRPSPAPVDGRASLPPILPPPTPPLNPPSTLTAGPTAEPTVAAVPEPTARPSVEETVTIVKATPSPKLATPPPATTPSAPPRAGATPGPAPTPTPAEVLRGQQTAAQVASLLTQAEGAMGARQYDAAIGALDEALRLDPGNARATANRASAVALRELARRRFVPGRTVVRTEKAQDGLAGFDGAAVQKAPDFLGRIEFEMIPPSAIQAGDNYNLKFYLVNEGKKTIRVASINVTTSVNGAGSATPVASKVRDVEPQQRAQLGEVSGSWKDGTTAWSAEILVTANKGDSLKNTIAWR